jgi:polynucleotide 5'-kinase involved in rRNA processing
MTPSAAENLSKRLQRERVRRFVGRAAEIDLFRAWLEASETSDVTSGSQEPFSVLWVYGPGGIGKSTLLRAFAESAHNAGYRLAQIDGGRIRPTPDGIRAGIWNSLAPT